MYLTYQNFKKYHELYDVVIVLVTYPGRIHTSVLPVPTGGVAKFWINLFNNRLTYSQKKVLRATGDFVDIIHLDSELLNQAVLFHNLLLEKIKSSRDDILFVPCFSVPNTEFNDTCLYDISLKEEKYWGSVWETVLKRDARVYDERQCHLTNQNNFILYEQIKNELLLVKGHKTFKIDISSFVDAVEISNYVLSKYYE